MSQLKGRSSQPGSWEELVSLCVGLKPEGFKRMAGTSRMSREVHVRICGGLVVRFLRSTRHCMMRRENPISGGPTKGESIDAYSRGGPSHSSDEVLVMRMERRGWASSWREQANQSSGRSEFLSVSARGREALREWLARAV
jgi:hypothetical protein